LFSSYADDKSYLLKAMKGGEDSTPSKKGKGFRKRTANSKYHIADEDGSEEMKSEEMKSEEMKSEEMKSAESGKKVCQKVLHSDIHFLFYTCFTNNFLKL
jgi:hypothetical protein